MEVLCTKDRLKPVVLRNYWHVEPASRRWATDSRRAVVQTIVLSWKRFLISGLLSFCRPQALDRLEAARTLEFDSLEVLPIAPKR